MKTIEDLKKQEPVFIDFENRKDIFKDFSEKYKSYKEYDKESNNYDDIEDHDNINILFAYYNYEDYSGDAFVLFEKDNKLFEVNGGHCSCYGLEGQWSPEETTLENITHRLVHGEMGIYYGNNEYRKELKLFLGIED